MPARLIDGTRVGDQLRTELQVEIRALQAKGVTPGLAAVLVGDNPASATYVRMKGKACDEAGLYHETIRLPPETSEAELLALVDRLNADNKIHGILVQLPLPKQITTQRVLRRVVPGKDVDGFHPENVGKVLLGDPTGFRPATPYGVQQLLLKSGVDTTGKHAVIVGRSTIVGRPMAALLLQDGPGGNATVTVCHSRTRDIKSITRMADILIVAMGKPEFVTGDMIKPGAVVVDVGTNRVDDPSTKKGYRLVGDVNFAEATHVAGAITPVPGGVGPMTITMLLHNTVQAARQWARA
ncbi:MAG: bifunctional 5,10-methylene-tetrahydrofolate dehydrogenase/5,10-methylene-tetrahydrofolate cyclohydrolase [Gemmatimonadetes bacterium 13_1_40CM_3_69_22]|nr:MAG: bifunctional 5,10-methylene-tetrahydrofolate dehydrogenase/5,10-methylene-tetrahydrofolate cyclohydrolase [Gemmatimonadetes bacterium 13_2_20CM_69_8]OLD01072.1 MAG: bifunctional 5,10-methylene-tetrahydrofolate dehydrogenase/5,10-methylene-tetrahydrofolate cyclohydrolase [Gemmatimonadetes bacterium 13_1_40CM_3_69_22]OLD93402.1 MAG: bifunctional 5,10-methylene-tetrahydrofolate dehydrogenase/5,10-methylene-tetrahydrofolate cyclohydrolase [Gemmatimonadetes bacterium 13_1_20CM_4_69_16]PYO1289